ncbi:MAG: response regulator [Steroidobacter sp.]
MINKRALVVDDSRSARVVLSRTLEGFGIIVDAVESAEIALDYLNASKPDIIFMDHLLTGMDGLAAVRIIKANPRTANIPVFMYSSQQETAFIHAARIAGALGVLPKTFKSADVARVLQQLRFAINKAEQAPPPASVAASSAKQFTSAQRIALTGLASALVFCIAALMYSNHRLQQQLDQSQRAASSSSSISASSTSQVMVVATPSTAHVIAQDSETVPYGEVPLAGSRLDRLRNMINDLKSKSFKGTVRVEVFTGDFCLQGNATDGYHVAPAELSIKQCDLLGNPFADVLSVQQRQSSSFAAFLADSSQLGNVHIQLADGGRQLATSYPPQLPGLEAGEWNLSAARNNRVEFTASAAE